MVKLTDKQKQQLYAFTQNHYVDWYDVQTELVNHLANGIEKQWQEQPNLSFEEAVQIEFSKFGVLGFSEVVEQRTKTLDKHYRTLIWQHIKTYFKLPRILLTLAIIYFYFTALSLLNNPYVLVLFTFLVFVVVTLWFLKKTLKRIKHLEKRTKKKWLFDRTILQIGSISSTLNIGIYGPVLFDVSDWSKYQNLFISVFIVLFGITLYTCIYVVGPKLRGDMIKRHPEYLEL